MGGEEPGGGPSSLRDNFMIRSIRVKKGGHRTSLFYFSGFLVYLVSCVNQTNQMNIL